ncbi:MAG TPA: hypothetical protein VN879_16060 [Candidatus Acidoferrales bacterium]|nr:hypothetical protein [Candidatus Acidoferrales bacterium]
MTYKPVPNAPPPAKSKHNAQETPKMHKPMKYEKPGKKTRS